MAQKVRKFGIFTRGSGDFMLIVVTLLLVSMGLIMVLSASSPSSLAEYGDSYKYLKRQVIAAIIGGAGLIVLSMVDYHNYKKYKWLKWIVYIASIILLLSVKLFGSAEKGAQRWIVIFGINFQPSEICKLVYIVFFAAILSSLHENGKIKNLFWGAIYPLLLIAPVGFIVFVFQNHFSAILIMGLVVVVQMFIAGVPIKNFLILAGLASPIAVAFGLKEFGGVGETEQGFRAGRVKTWLNPFENPTSDGWQIINSLYAIASGGIFGVGLGASKQKYLYIPEPQNDFIFAVLAEELGYFGAICVMILFGVFIWRGIVIALNAKDSFGSLIAIGVVALIGLQAIINIAVVSNTMPVTGMPLPFFSYGGTAIITNLCAVGLLINVSKTGNNKK